MPPTYDLSVTPDPPYALTVDDNGDYTIVISPIGATGPAGTVGPAGPPGPNSITSTTTSDGTANLSISNITTSTATVSGTLTAPHIHGNLAGSVYAHIRAGENLAKGDPVYVSGSHGSGSSLIAIVSKADAANSAKMPAVGVMDSAVVANATGHMVITGTITDTNTNAYSVNAELYVAEGGGLTATQPAENIQPVARVERVNANNGAFIVKVNGLSSIGDTSDSAGKLARYGPRGELVAVTDTGAAGYFENTGTAAGIRARTTTGNYHAEFGPTSSSDATYIERLKGAIAWLRGAFVARIHPPDTLTATRTYTLPDASGTISLSGHTHVSADITDTTTNGVTNPGKVLRASSNSFLSEPLTLPTVKLNDSLGHSLDVGGFYQTFTQGVDSYTWSYPESSGTITVLRAFAGESAAISGGVQVGDVWWDSTLKKARVRLV
jgi:hypothetical protein